MYHHGILKYNIIMFMEKPSCINELKELVDSLSDKEYSVKKYALRVKEIISDSSLTDRQKILKIKEICKNL
jgi:hypothetical protein